MADNLTFQAATLATLPTGSGVATRQVTYSGDTNQHIAPVGLVTFAGSDDAKTATDVTTSNPLPVAQQGNVTVVGTGTFSVQVSNTVGISGTVAVSGTVTVDTELPAAAALADAAANPTTPTAGAANLIYNGATWDRVRGDTTNGVDVDVTRIIPGTGATHLGKAEDTVHSDGDTGVMALAVRKDTAVSLSSSDGDYTPLIVDSSGRLHVIPAQRTIDAISTCLQTDGLANGLTILTPKFAKIDCASSGDNTIVALVGGKKIRVLRIVLVVTSAVTAKFKSSGGTDLTGPMALAANGGMGASFCPLGAFETAVGEGLVLNLGSAVQASGNLTYVEV